MPKTTGCCSESMRREFDELLEDLEAASSKDLRTRVCKARKGLKNAEVISLTDLIRQYGE